MTKDEAARIYSFIGPFSSDPVLGAYGDNALPLFAVALFLDIEDVSSFATESLTDDPADKKADIIYISEADGVACVAQGYTSQTWSKNVAPANKASDLNTAAAWLLQQPIDEVPLKIRQHAQLLRDGLAGKTITKVIFAYAHNALESQNVDSELQAVRNLLSGLECMQGVEIEVVELGLRRIEALHLTSLGSIQVTEQIDIPCKNIVFQEGPGWRAYIMSMSGALLQQLYESHSNALFSATRLGSLRC